MVWCGVVGHGRAGQFLLRFHFAVSSSRPQMELNSCHRDLKWTRAPAAIGACGLGDRRAGLVYICPISQHDTMNFFLTFCVLCIV